MSDTNSGTATEEEIRLKGESAERLLWLLVIGLPVSSLHFGFDAFILMWFWKWFLTPLGIVAIGFWHSCGIATFWSFVRYKPDGAVHKSVQEGIEELKRKYGDHTLVSTTIFFLGFLIHWLMTR